MGVKLTPGREMGVKLTPGREMGVKSTPECGMRNGEWGMGMGGERLDNQGYTDCKNSSE